MIMSTYQKAVIVSELQEIKAVSTQLQVFPQLSLQTIKCKRCDQCRVFLLSFGYTRVSHTVSTGAALQPPGQV